MPSSPLSQPTNAKVLSLPPELVEQALILSAAGGFPSAIACLGQTCRYFHQLIYRSTDNHLWREVFLTTFDDPRPLLGRLRAATAFAPTGETIKDMEPPFDWAGEFTCRIGAKKLFEKYTRNSSIETPSDLSQALKTLLAVLESASPFSPHRNNDFTTITPTFPPIIILHASPIPFPAEFKSRSSAWLEDVLETGYPPSLVQKFLVDGHQRRQRKKGSEEIVWENSDEGKLFHKLIFLKGFLPTPPPPELDALDPGALSRSSPSSTSTQSSQVSVAEQLATAREMARTRVYNLRYLMPERCWGPFLPDNGKAREAILRTRFPDFEEELSRQIMNVDEGVAQNSQLIHITSDADEGFYPFLTIDGSDFHRADTGDDDDLPSQISDEDDEDLGFVTINGHARDAAFVPPKPHQVVPDYAFLSAARLLVEMNLKEVLALDTNDSAGNPSVDASVSRLVDAFACLDLMRMGGAPSFWSESWPICPDQPGEDYEPLLDIALDHGKGKGKAKETDEFEGWDWAGVAGEWKRSVCWLDYRDLLLHNLTGFPSENLEETMRIFPMTLRVSGYSKPPEPDPMDNPSARELESLVWKLPIIHVEGESKGSDMDSTVIRQVRGSVRMIGDGAVRWSLTSSYPGEDSPEWLTEGVQVGSIGSAVGMIGMWTGADHASTDPLGPVWAWKVA